MIVAYLIVQSLVFAAWAVTSFSILWAILRRAVREAPLPGPTVQLSAVRAYLGDPVTRRRRMIWLGLTLSLLVLSVISGAALSGL